VNGFYLRLSLPPSLPTFPSSSFILMPEAQSGLLYAAISAPMVVYVSSHSFSRFLGTT